MIFYAIIGLHLFMGAYEYRCRVSPEPIDGEFPLAEGIPFLCGSYECSENTYCRAPS